MSLGLVTGVTVKLGVGASRQRLGPVGEPCGDEAVIEDSAHRMLSEGSLLSRHELEGW